MLASFPVLIAALPDVTVARGLSALTWPGAALGVMLLGFVVSAVLRSWRVAWPFAGGVLGALVGIALLWGRVFRTITGPIVLSVVCAVVVGAVLFALWLIVRLRARALERRMLSGIGSAPGVGDEQVARLREDMAGALQLLQKAGRGRTAIYTLPWLLVVGRPQAGKTVAIKNSGLNLPVRKDWVKGVGGTHTCDWFFTNDLIFLDTPGKWVTEGSGPADRTQWTELLRLLRKNRARRPLDGLVVVVPADDLLTRPETELREQAGRIRDVIDLMHEQLGFRFPVYLVISKTDLVEGFVDFFRGLPASRRNEMLGCSHVDASAADPAALVREGMGRVLRGLEACRLDLLARVPSRRQARRLFFFAEEFKRLGTPLAAFAEVLFRQDRYHEPPLFRGFYFTSGTQGEGFTLGHAMAGLAQNLGLPAPAPKPAGTGGEPDEPKRSYFLLDLFRSLMAGDQALVNPTSGSGGRYRRLRMALTFGPAVAMAALLCLSSCSLVLNRSIYESIRTDVPVVVHELEKVTAITTGDQFRRVLDLTGKLQAHHRELAGFSPWRGFGMRRPGELEALTLQAFDKQFNRTALGAGLGAAQSYALDHGKTCGDRLDVLHGVVQLRQGGGWLKGAAPAGLDKVFGVNPDQAAALSDELLHQFDYLQSEKGPRPGTRLPGFSLLRVATSIKTDCFTRRAGSGLETYLQFQNDCQARSTPADMAECYGRLKQSLGFDAGDQQTLVGNLQDLKDGLSRLSGEEPEAKGALQLLETVQQAQATTGECLTTFAKDVAPLIRDYANQDDMLAQCRDEVNAVPDPAGKAARRDEILRAQDGELAKKEDALRVKFQDFSTSCRGSVSGFTRLEPGVIKRITAGYRRTACLQLGSQFGAVGEMFGSGARGRFPFTSDPAARPVETKTLVDLLGGQSGYVVKLNDALGGKGLSPAALRWLNDATALSKLFFEEHSDNLKPERLRITVEEPIFEPAEVIKDVKVEAIKLHLGEQQDLAWRPEDPRTRTVDLDLFGRGASEASSVSMIVAAKKTGLFKKGFEAGQPSTAVTSEGTWAPMRLFAKGLPAPAHAGQETLELTYKVTFPVGKKTGTAQLRFRVDGEDLGRLMALLRTPFPQPPASGGE